MFAKIDGRNKKQYYLRYMLRIFPNKTQQLPLNTNLYQKQKKQTKQIH